MNQCLEFGIIEKWNKMDQKITGFVVHSLLMNFYADDKEIKEKLNHIKNYFKETIQLGDYGSTFKLLGYGIAISAAAFLVEKILEILNMLN